MHTLKELLLLLRLANAELCVKYNQDALYKAREGLEKALFAREQAAGNLQVFLSHSVESNPPSSKFLEKE